MRVRLVQDEDKNPSEVIRDITAQHQFLTARLAS